MALVRAYIDTPYHELSTVTGLVWRPDLSGIPETEGWVLIAADRDAGISLLLIVADGVTRGELESPRGYTVYGVEELDSRGRRTAIPEQTRLAVTGRASQLGRTLGRLEWFDVNPPGLVS